MFFPRYAFTVMMLLFNNDSRNSATAEFRVKEKSENERKDIHTNSLTMVERYLDFRGYPNKGESSNLKSTILKTVENSMSSNPCFKRYEINKWPGKIK